MASEPVTHEITVNGKKHEFTGSVIDYDDIVRLFGGRKHGLYTVTWYVAGGKENGSLSPGQCVTARPKMHFNIAYTGRA